eukprot:CAMPEP_0174316806 /NCGR_PEP_ID=MMETSP0810-20121108/7197_1 /TAXON_ID=73025 ORGANISM="Eutreptiella gymnastica-like, Strain CCMP1594" /NCGR_SAMPLE_ID=MMETSP0810 /ASSEMBLY_ACC=CAM_ASM_000659 /LENGTH=206 /DNA_ID=CAMNT_0015426645 /DNA_START=243 /DNA_END=862 /DNA_ORIENTATION=+
MMHEIGSEHPISPPTVQLHPAAPFPKIHNTLTCPGGGPKPLQTARIREPPQDQTCSVDLETGRACQSVALGMAVVLRPHPDSTFQETRAPQWWRHTKSCRTSCLGLSDSVLQAKREGCDCPIKQCGLEHRDDEQNLIPGDAAETAPPRGTPLCCWSTRMMEAEENSGVQCTEETNPKLANGQQPLWGRNTAHTAQTQMEGKMQAHL